MALLLPKKVTSTEHTITPHKVFFNIFYKKEQFWLQLYKNFHGGLNK